MAPKSSENSASAQRAAGVEQILNRRDIARRGILFAIAMALGKLDVLEAQGGQLTCDLSQWREVVFKFHGETLKWTSKEIFEALK